MADASLRAWSVDSGLHQVFTDVAGSRLWNRVYDHADDWEAEVVEQFNEIVAEQQLNEIAADLPDFTSPEAFNVLRLGERQGRAVELWRTAVSRFSPLWAAYVRLAKLRGSDIGMRDAGSVADNLVLACTIGDPGSFGTAESASTWFVRMEAGTTSARPLAPLAPFIVPALVGYELRLHTVSEAQRVRENIQPR